MLNETFSAIFNWILVLKNVKEVGAWLSLKNSSHRYDTTKALKHPPSSTHSWTFAKKCSRRHIEEAFSIGYFSHKILSKTNCIEVLVLTSLFPLFPLIKTLMPMVLYYWNISFGKKMPQSQLKNLLKTENMVVMVFSTRKITFFSPLMHFF